MSYEYIFFFFSSQMDIKIEITEIDFDKAYSENLLLCHFKTFFSGNLTVTLRVRIEDPFFGSDFFIGPTIVLCQNSWEYWVSFRIKDILSDPTLGFRGGFIIIFEDANSGLEIMRKSFTPGGIDYNLRKTSPDAPYDKPRLFMVGDSHTWTNYGQSHERIDEAGGYVLSRHVVYKVSSFSFWKGNYSGFLSLLPLESQDALLFSFGTYDLRRGCFKLAKTRNIPVMEIVYQTLFQTLYKLKSLREIYPTIPFIISSVVPPIRLKNIPEQDHNDHCWSSSDEERLAVYETYRNFWTRQAPFLDSCSFLDWTSTYKDQEGFCIPDEMRAGDIHVQNFRPALACLDEHLTKIKR